MKELGQLPDCFLVKGCVPVKTALKILQSHDHSLIFSLICSFTFFFFYFVNGFFYSLISYFHLSHTLIPQLSFFFSFFPTTFPLAISSVNSSPLLERKSLTELKMEEDDSEYFKIHLDVLFLFPPTSIQTSSKYSFGSKV